jgi:IMP dehydrogenase
MSEAAYTFDDVMFEPQYSEIRSRSEVSLSSKIGDGFYLRLPVISANMADVTEKNMAIEMAKNGGMGIIHRFMSIEENVEMFLECKDSVISEGLDLRSIGVSIGVGEECKERFKALRAEGAITFCIDVAHGHHIHVKNMLKWVRGQVQEDDEIILIAGNVASVAGAWDLYQWGADVIKVGVGPGGLCQTRENTGVGIPQLYVLEKIANYFDDNTYDWQENRPYIIADGGIKKTGDIAKALKYADAVMLGSFLSGTSETPGHVYESMEGKFYKTIAGSASAESKVRSGKSNSFVEGGIRQVEFRGKVKFILRKIKENVQSSFSYAGAKNIGIFRKKSKLVKISGGGKKESKF